MLELINARELPRKTIIGLPDSADSINVAICVLSPSSAMKIVVKGVINISELNNKNSSVFNLGHFQTMNVKNLADIVCDEMNLNKVEYHFTGGERGWVGDSPLVHLDTKKANKYGWEAEISIEDSIRTTVRYLLSENSKRFR